MSASTIRIFRPSSYTDSLRIYKIKVDGVVMGKIADGETKEFAIEAGAHTIYASIDWGKINKINFESGVNETVAFKCSSNVTRGKLLLGILYATFLRGRYLKLKKL